MTELLSSLIFEAYVCFGNQRPDSGNFFEKMSAALLFQRLRSSGNAPVNVVLAPSSAHRLRIEKTMDDALSRIRRIDNRDIETSMRVGRSTEAGCIVVEYVAQIVRQRLADPTSLEARAFERIHPAKLRLIQDFDRGEFFSRKRKFGS